MTQATERRGDLLASSKALLELDAAGALVPHGLGGHGRNCLSWCVAEFDRLRSLNAEMAAELQATERYLAEYFEPDHTPERLTKIRAALSKGRDAT